MPDYMFLLESRLSPEQRAALVRVQELARAQDSNVYLTGGAVGFDFRNADPRPRFHGRRESAADRARELRRAGHAYLCENEHLRHCGIIFAGDADGSIFRRRAR